ncbi:hemolysin family protein [Propionimicrobium sp. PCR01-08-3]|uniref:hemolysin family protein n=1 Tax=Propionimicrobium sp. PCR01-08-3 TaxID=3052086 RepID=UPI00255C2896|nr:hemolysin family protein [Propionimicrobium sp. PCR01-08-3]WIY83281.1 hemolysin family protein [Propionimicrobium sp. PCR01-08-3]
MPDLLISIGVIFVLLFVGFLFSAAEMALVTLRDSQIQKLQAKGKRGQAIVALTDNPNKFLSSVQIGVTLAGFLSSAFGSDSLAGKYLAPWFESLGLASGLSSVLAVIVITAIISFLSIVLSELTAKRMAMQRTEEFALALAPMVSAIAKVATPLIWLIDKCTNIMVRILGGDPAAAKEAVTEDELRSMVANADMLGDEERRIVDDVFDAGDRSLREVMVPRTEVDFLSGDMPAYQAVRLVQDNQRSRYPVTDGSPDQIIGFLHVRDLMNLDTATRQAPIRQLVRPILSLPETVKVLRALTEMRRESSHLAIVRDEYGGTAGIVTMEDLIEELIGDITDEYDVVDADQIQHEMVSDLEGLISLEDFEDRTGFVIPEGPYDTLAGYFMWVLGRVPKLNDKIVVELAPENAPEDDPQLTRFSMRVSEMDGHRIAWIDLGRLETVGAPAAPESNSTSARS